MYLNNSKKIVIKIGSSLLINDKKVIRKKWLSEFSKDLRKNAECLVLAMQKMLQL